MSTSRSRNSNLQIVLLCIVQWICDIYAYYVSPNQFNYVTSNVYCQNHCNTELASIHSEEDNNDAIYQSRTTSYQQSSISDDQVWFGLNQYFQHPGYTYTDFSTFDYGVAFNQHPWNVNYPMTASDPSDYYGVSFDAMNEWINNDIADEQRFLCKSCDGVLNKYVISTSTYSWVAAWQYCTDIIGTNIASIHSDVDHTEAALLCTSRSCWIGLKDEGNEVLSWFDGTDIDYGSSDADIYPSPPWNSSKTPPLVSSNENYAYYQEGSLCLDCEVWAMGDGDDARYVLCNMPSELCDFVASWTSLYGTPSFADCSLSVEDDDNMMTIIDNKIWNNANSVNPNNGNQLNVLLVEYIFQMTSFHADATYPTIGIMIFNFGINNICDYYLAKIYVDTANSDIAYLQLELHLGETEYTLNTILINHSPSTNYVALKVKITDGTKFKISVNGDVAISGINAANFVTNLNPSMDTRIGLTTTETNIIAKSLYVSGTITMQSIDVSTAYTNCSTTTTSTSSPNQIATNPETTDEVTTTGIDGDFNETDIDDVSNEYDESTTTSTTKIQKPSTGDNDKDNAAILGLELNEINIILIVGVLLFIVCCCLIMIGVWRRKKNGSTEYNHVQQKQKEIIKTTDVAVPLNVISSPSFDTISTDQKQPPPAMIQNISNLNPSQESQLQPKPLSFVTPKPPPRRRQHNKKQNEDKHNNDNIQSLPPPNPDDASNFDVNSVEQYEVNHNVFTMHTKKGNNESEDSFSRDDSYDMRNKKITRKTPGYIGKQSDDDNQFDDEGSESDHDDRNIDDYVDEKNNNYQAQNVQKAKMNLYNNPSGTSFVIDGEETQQNDVASQATSKHYNHSDDDEKDRNIEHNNLRKYNSNSYVIDGDSESSDNNTGNKRYYGTNQKQRVNVNKNRKNINNMDDGNYKNRKQNLFNSNTMQHPPPKRTLNNNNHSNDADDDDGYVPPPPAPPEGPSVPHAPQPPPVFPKATPGYYQ